VQPPQTSWGILISDGQQRVVTAPWLEIAPAVAIVLTVLSLNIFGDGLRDALDPRAKVRVEH
jgi:peptide/nickel transport system permease protein